MRKKKRTKRTRTGSKILTFTLLVTALLTCPSTVFGKKDKAKAAAPAFALIAGTVYRPPGFALVGAEIVIAPEPTDDASAKLKKINAVTDARGEWAVRVPPVPATWRVDVKMNGYRPEHRSVSVTGEERIDVSIILEPTRQPKEATQ